MNSTNLHRLSLLLFLAATLLHGYAALRFNTNLQSGDQGAYLHLALAQAEGRNMTDGNRHPLYPALLFPMAERSPEFFARARWVSFFFGTGLLVLIAGYEWKARKDPLAGALALAVFSVQVQMARTLSEIWCEPLLYLLVYTLWLLSGKIREGRSYLLLAGLLTGLAYLTKGTGLLVSVLFWVTAFATVKPRKWVAVGLLIFLVVSSPLLVWNTITHGNPTYSFASTHNMWFDEADQIWYNDATDLPTLGTYLQTHNFSEISSRFAHGLWLESKMAFQLLWSDWSLPNFAGTWFQWFHTLFKGMVFLLIASAIVLYFLRKLRAGDKSAIPSPTPRACLLFFSLMVLAFFPSFGWYAQLTNQPRFLMTLAPIAVVLGARAVSNLLHRARSSRNRMLRAAPSIFVYLMLAEAFITIAISADFARTARTFPPPKLENLAQSTLTAVDNLPEDSAIASGPSHGLPLWLSRGDIRWRYTPWEISWEQFVEMLDREGIGYVLIDRETIARRPYLQKLTDPSAVSDLGWKILYRDRGKENLFVLYEVM